jgi:hypothetical protein
MFRQVLVLLLIQLLNLRTKSASIKLPQYWALLVLRKSWQASDG